MREKSKDWLLIIFGVILLPFVFVAIQGIFASLFTSLIYRAALFFSAWIDLRYSLRAIPYIMGTAGSFVSAFLVLFPTGYFKSDTKLFIGWAIGTVAVIELILITHTLKFSVLIEYFFLILFCGIAVILGSKARGLARR